ncbi:YqkE family protein [Sporosarcina sp. ACRSM]|uniref:YqkE family protein n=1 Tax=Sporosarcina sp. ACRSM TaxID=2918216 RepID=UPI001EF6288A|nr:YqkE family protein [Sporosarcina sp. ACRSM]MCG7333959.1 YqkE family protein [Sporosarcina sp. ACRSM]
MAKKRRQPTTSPKKTEQEGLTLSDALGDDILEKLKAAKKELSVAEQEKEEKRQEQLRRERKEREKNKSFEELLEEYGDVGSKY